MPEPTCNPWHSNFFTCRQCEGKQRPQGAAYVKRAWCWLDRQLSPEPPALPW